MHNLAWMDSRTVINWLLNICSSIQTCELCIELFSLYLLPFINAFNIFRIIITDITTTLLRVSMILKDIKIVLNCRSDERGIHVNELSRELKLPTDKIMLALVFLY